MRFARGWGEDRADYCTDLGALFRRLRAAVAAVPRDIPDPPSALQLTAFTADELKLAIPFWIADPDMGQGGVRPEVNLAVSRALNETGLEITFPYAHSAHRVRLQLVRPAPCIGRLSRHRVVTGL